MKTRLLCVFFALAFLLASPPLARAAGETEPMEETVSLEETAPSEDTESPGEAASPGDSAPPVSEEENNDAPALPEDVPSWLVPAQPSQTPEEEPPVIDEPSIEPPAWLLPPAQDGEVQPPVGGQPSAGTDVPVADPALPSETFPAPELPPAQSIFGAEDVEPLPVISVTVPATGNVIVNPYRLSVTVDGVESREQVVSGVYSLVNCSEVPVSMSVSAAGSTPMGSEAMVVPYLPAADTPWKEVFLFAEFQNAAYGAFWSGVYTGAANQVPVDGILRLDVLTLEAGGTGLFRLFGSAATSPERMWTAADTVNVTMAFTFAPLYTTESVNYEGMMP